MKKHIRIIIVIILVKLLIVGAYFAWKHYNNSKVDKGMAMQKSTAVQSHKGYKMILTSDSVISPSRKTTIRYKIENDTGETLKEFMLNHTKLMHFIIVRKDLQNFQHVHPDFNKSTNEFSVDTVVPEEGPYRLFADFTPADVQKGMGAENQNVTTFYDITVGKPSNYKPKEIIVDDGSKEVVDGYDIQYNFPDESKLKSTIPISFNLYVTRNGKPVKNLEQYLGAQAHSIVLKENTLNFLHLHASGSDQPMTDEHMDNMQEFTNRGPTITFNATFPEPGIYKLFTQFQVEGKVITTTRVIKIYQNI